MDDGTFVEEILSTCNLVTADISGISDLGPRGRVQHSPCKILFETKLHIDQHMVKTLKR
jgi:hypothetical protein